MNELFYKQLKEIRDQISDANKNASELYNIVDEASNFALEVSEDIERALKKLDGVVKSIEDEKLNPFKEAA